MVELMRILPVAVLALALAACGGAVEGPSAESEKAEAAAEAAIDPKAAAEAAKDKEETDKLAALKPTFDAALATGDPLKVSELADAGNAWALHHRALERVKSHDFMLQQGGFEDMEAAAEGLMMMERAARRGNIEAMVAVGEMYEQDAYMHDTTKARSWYERAVAVGSTQAKDALARMDGGAPADAEPETSPEAAPPSEP
ncbi:MAG: hypothetical protein B7Y90_16715 [Alphaproteobacteria bacterium 32-64-14]|nr:MAG: hypothetical protein B7Y90_16715 [Alphaproteobacteria bacterium 32-64-14]